VRIIGIDPGLARVGYGIIEIENDKKILLDCGVIETGKDKKKKIDFMRYSKILMN